MVVIPDGSHSAEAANILAHEDPNATAAQHRQTLLKAFEEMDEDGSGQIDVKELGRLKPPKLVEDSFEILFVCQVRCSKHKDTSLARKS